MAPLETNIKGEKDMCRHDLFLRPDQSRIVFHFLGAVSPREMSKLKARSEGQTEWDRRKALANVKCGKIGDFDFSQIFKVYEMSANEAVEAASKAASSECTKKKRKQVLLLFISLLRLSGTRQTLCITR